MYKYVYRVSYKTYDVYNLIYIVKRYKYTKLIKTNLNNLSTRYNFISYRLIAHI